MKILLFSGGIDSTCLAWMERPDRLAFIDYGQIPAAGELRASEAIAADIGIRLDVLRADMRQFGGGTMAGTTNTTSIAPEFWPFRNQMLITLAAMAYSEAGLEEILIGTVRSDRQHPDGRAPFIRAMDRTLQSQSNIRVRAPASKEHTYALATRSGTPFHLLGWTFSCHTGEWACGQCRGCHKHTQVRQRIGF